MAPGAPHTGFHAAKVAAQGRQNQGDAARGPRGSAPLSLPRFQAWAGDEAGGGARPGTHPRQPGAGIRGQ